MFALENILVTPQSKKAFTKRETCDKLSTNFLRISSKSDYLTLSVYYSEGQKQQTTKALGETSHVSNVLLMLTNDI